MSTSAGIIVLIGRILFSINFGPVAGVGFHIRQTKMAEGYSRSVGFLSRRSPGGPRGSGCLPHRCR